MNAGQVRPTMPRVAAFARYGSLGASSRVRMAQYAPALAEAGLALSLHPLLDDAYLRVKYAERRTPWWQVARLYAVRAGSLVPVIRDADLVWVEKELWPWAPAWLERSLLAARPWVLDIDDALFHQYDMHPRALVRSLWGRKLDALMRSARLVTAGNDYLAARARDAGAKRVEVLPTVVDLARYAAPARRQRSHTKEPFVIGWIGSPSTVGYLQALAAPLARLSATRDIELRVIGAQLTLNGVRVVHVPWSEASEVAAIAACDMGVMPLPDSPWERGKCGYKLIQYMACGLPAVASPVGANCKIVSEGETGFLASTPIEWEIALRRLADDADLRTRLGAAGRRRVEDSYSLQAQAPRLVGWMQELTGRGRLAPAGR